MGLRAIRPVVLENRSSSIRRLIGRGGNNLRQLKEDTEYREAGITAEYGWMVTLMESSTLETV